MPKSRHRSRDAKKRAAKKRKARLIIKEGEKTLLELPASGLYSEGKVPETKLYIQKENQNE